MKHVLNGEKKGARMKTRKLDAESDACQPPEWLGEALRIYKDAADERDLNVEPESVSPVFQQKCREAGEVAFALAKLRKERQRIHFVPLSLTSYFKELGRVAGVALLPVLAWLGITDLALSTDASIRGIARLAKAVGLSLREALVHLRISFAEQEGYEPMLLAHCRSNGKPDASMGKLRECELRLVEIESQFHPELQQKLRHFEAELRLVYGREEEGSQ